jgi:hypothetical protein
MPNVMRALPSVCLTLGTAAALALAGCGTAHAPAAATAGQTPRQRAQAEAAALLASFVPPPGATRLAKAPDLPGGYLKTPITTLVDGYQVDGTTFWQAPGAPRAVLNWEIAHISRRFSLGDADYGTASDRSFALPPVPGVLTSRDLVVEVVSVGDGRTGIRVDAEVGWQPSRPAGDRVPSAARVVTITEETTMETGRGMPSPVTITDPAVVAGLSALVGTLPISPLDGTAASCPGAFGSFLALTFRASAGGQVLATVRTDQSCGVTIFSANPNQAVALTQPATLDQQILTIAGLTWKMG